ncbi:hypothetical protein ACXZ66_10400 [Corynebacterium sp. S7]
MKPNGSRTFCSRLATLFLVGTASISLGACSNSGGEEASSVVTITQTKSVAPAPSSDTVHAAPEIVEINASQAYAKVLANPSAYPVNPAAEHEPDGTYSYAVVEATGDSTPELLVKVNGKEFTPVMVFSIDQSTGEVIHSPHVLIAGAQSAGGGRQDVAGSLSGTGIHELSWQSISPTAKNTFYQVQGDLLVPTATDTFALETGLPDHAPLTWFDTNDPSQLGFIQNASPTLGQAAQPETTTAPAGEYVFSGTVINQTTSEAMNGRRAPNGEADVPGYIQLVLDAPQEVTAVKAGGMHTESVQKIRLAVPNDPSGSPINWEQYVGQHITVATSQQNLGYPSDTSIPLGMLAIDGSPTISLS